MASMVHRLKRHAACHGPIADHGNRVAAAFVERAAQIMRRAKTQSRRDRSRAMRRAEGIKNALGAFGKA